MEVRFGKWQRHRRGRTVPRSGPGALLCATGDGDGAVRQGGGRMSALGHVAEAEQARETLLAAGFPDFAAARAYYTAFYAASALLVAEGKTFRSHRGCWPSYTETMSNQDACRWTWAESSVRYRTCEASAIMAAQRMSVMPRPL